MDKRVIKSILEKNYYLYKIGMFFISIYARRGLKITKPLWGGVKIKYYNVGKNNYFIADKGCFLENLYVKIIGSNNRIEIGKNVKIRKNCKFYIFGNNCSIKIGDNTTMTHHCQIEVQEESQHIFLGKDCMLSNHILIRNNDSHFIYNRTTGQRTNNPKNINIGNHVWIGAWVTVLKGVDIEDGAVIGTHSIVTHNVPKNSIVTGIPAKIVKENIEWTVSAKKQIEK
ncbi:MAG: acyltransferase [Bacteroidales bacterium]